VGVGWGAGGRELADRPNLLRVIAGTPAALAAGARCLVIEANVDDSTPELLAPLLAELLDAGARDAWLTPV
ncbi:nickel insertion protein, partial [Klebsiella pneumoniae]|uniref:nickel insertion protein n=1 Tax=Klebsiella pneumoniae TaxID=573 RepID=UPI003EDF68A3